jgi:hypothetical protein
MRPASRKGHVAICQSTQAAYERTTRILCATLVVFNTIFLSSCGYTILETRSKAGQDPVEEALPDLVIEEISNYTVEEGPYMDSSEPYRWMTVFGAKVTNRGTADFAGRVALAWTDDPDEIRYGMYRAIGGEAYLRLMPDSSGTIRGSLWQIVYRPGTPLLFSILTDRFEPGQVGELYKFGSTPYQELSTKNNTLLYTVE